MTLSINGATNMLSKSMSNVVVHIPLLFFYIEYLRSDLKRATTRNVFERLKNLLERIEREVAFKRSTSFESDRCNGMRDVRKMMMEENVVKWAYGCVTHFLNNYCEDRCRECVSGAVQEALFVYKAVRGSNMVRKVLEALCIDKLNVVYFLVLYSKSRWSSINLMFQDLLQVKEVLFYLSPA